MGNFLTFLAAVFSSGVIATIISFSFSERKDRLELRRKKIEEIYLNAESWLKFVHSDFMLELRVSKGKLSYNQMLDLKIKRAAETKDIGENHLKMKMNIYMYEPSLIPYFEEMETELRKANKLRFGIEDCWKRSGQASEFFEPLNRQLENLETASGLLTEKIINRGVEIAHNNERFARMYDSLSRSSHSAWQFLTGQYHRVSDSLRAWKHTSRKKRLD